MILDASTVATSEGEVAMSILEGKRRFIPNDYCHRCGCLFHWTGDTRQAPTGAYGQCIYSSPEAAGCYLMLGESNIGLLVESACRALCRA